MIVAITGGTGFIGRHLIARHVALGDQVRYLTRKKESKEFIGASAFIGNLNSSVEVLRQFVRGVDVLYHCAAELRNEKEMHNTNVLGTANLIAASCGEIGRWVQLSSVGVYGNKLQGNISEDAPLNPANAYEISKTSSDLLVFEAVEKRNLQCVVVRPSIIYGVDMPNQSLFQLIKMVDRGMFFFIGKPGAIANYIHVENVVDALVLCGTSTLPANGRTYIVSDYRKLEELIGIIATALEKSTPRKRLPEFIVRAAVAAASAIPGFPLSSSRVNALTNRAVYFSERIKSELGYKYQISMEEGIGELARFWKK